MKVEFKMALPYSKHLYIKILYNNSLKLCFPLLGSKHQFVVSVVKFSSDSDYPNKNVNRAMKAYLERAKEYDLFIKEQLEEFNLGKEHLANMMGVKHKDMTQEDVNKAIEYLFPSGLTIKSAKPIMKPPNELFGVQKSAEFDYTGRPHHFLFYTGKPNFSQLLYDAAKNLEYLDEVQEKKAAEGETTPDKPLILMPGGWITHEKLEKNFVEKLYTIDYNKFVEVFDRLAAHPYNYLLESFIRSYKKSTQEKDHQEILKPNTDEKGRLYVKISEAPRKTARADVIIRSPGQGLVKINNVGIDYFVNMESREQCDVTISIDTTEEDFCGNKKTFRACWNVGDRDGTKIILKNHHKNRDDD